MRLKSIKLAGFKSFVDPTSLMLPGNLCAIVGPNGCGKSNIIDAVRWVMGESSAKSLRGESMTDVIFNGARSRKPVGQASVELIFDNKTGALGGQYAQYAEIAVKRIVTREAISTYYLNGTKCRRRDISDIFLGTGLGPRSYAIIGQGTISQLIEAKPEELRVFIEEAAGISKYKERRREAENRIRNTQENLARLEDLQQELDKQLEKLQRQAQAAKKYKEYKEQQRLLGAQLQALNWRQLNGQLEQQQVAISQQELALEQIISEQRHSEAQIEQQRQAHIASNDHCTQVQEQYYALGNNINRIEQNMRHAKEKVAQLEQDLAEVQQSQQETAEQLQLDQQQISELSQQAEELEPDYQKLIEAQQTATQALAEQEQQTHSWQQQWDAFHQQATGSKRAAEIEQSRIQQQEQSIRRLRERLEKLAQEKQQLAANPEQEHITELEEQLAELREQRLNQQQQLEHQQATLTSRRQQSKTLGQQLDQQQTQLQQLQGRLASLEELQQAALNQEQQANWLNQQGLDNHPPLAELLRVSAGWELAVETVLGQLLQAIALADFGQLADLLTDSNPSGINFLDKNYPPQQTTDPGAGNFALASLASKVNAPLALSRWLDPVYIVDDLAQAFSYRSQLNSSQSLVTPQGIWLGANWLITPQQQDPQQSLLKRQQTMSQLTIQVTELQQHITEQQGQWQQLQKDMSELESQIQQNQQLGGDIERQYGSVNSDLSAKQARIEQVKDRLAALTEEQQSWQQELTLEQEQLVESRLTLEEAIEQMAGNNEAEQTLLSQKEQIWQEVASARQEVLAIKDRYHQLAVQRQDITSRLASTRQGLTRLTEQSARLITRQQNLQQALAENQLPGTDQQAELTDLLEQRLTVEQQLASARQAVDSLAQQLTSLEKSKNQAEQQAQQLRNELENHRLERQTLTVKCQGLEEQLRDSQFDLATVLKQLPEQADLQEWQAELSRVEKAIDRLGTINLAAIEEYDTQASRKDYLDQQQQDLIAALETLNNAIRKIDRETRAKFKQTFEHINQGLQALFPKVFGGGQAYLALTSDELLESGVTIMAQPPGKRNSTIYLLSGGEKALTAIALVFAIFQLNPAPFCMLDEVDAPLDDANVGRFSNLVAEMSQQVQFIYISHNKITMEIAEHLAGVTMQEAGVSRLVSVDMAEAEALAEN